MANSVKTTTDWMSLFLGSTRSGGGAGAGGFSVNRYSSYSRDGDRYHRDTERDSDRYSSSRYSTVTSPSSSRRRTTSSYSSSSTSSYSRFLPSSRWTPHHYSDEETEEERDSDNIRDRDGRRVMRGQVNTVSKAERNLTTSESETQKQNIRNKSQVTVLNEGAVIIRRPGRAESSDDEESEEEKEEQQVEEEVQPEEPPRDPLEVEEEMLNEKLQTAGFFLSMPEEEQIKKRLLEIKQMRENPELFTPQNTKNFKYSQVSTETAKHSLAKEEEEKILLLRLGSRGIAEVEQTDVQVRLQEIWRDRREEVTIGIGRMEQHYEHILNECSTEISELEGSISNKYAAISKLQEELLVLSMRKDRVAEDMEKVTEAHQEKLEILKKELGDIEIKSSTYSIVRNKKVEESSLPESERSEIESELECPVCLEISRPPIYQCPEGHLICSSCKPLLKACCLCEAKFTDPPIRCRFAEKLAARYFKDEE